MASRRRSLSATEDQVSCKNCSLTELCLPRGMNGSEMDALDEIVDRQQPYQPGQHLFRAGENSHAVFAVRSGALKTYCTTADGDEQVLGFTLPGELVGLDGMNEGHYESSTVVLETASVCELSYTRLDELCHHLPGLNRQMMRVISREISSDHHMMLLLGKRAADERLATFLLSLSGRYHSRGLSATEFNLPMTRMDIGNFLGLAIETVSRLFAQFQKDGLLSVERRQIRITDLDRLKAMVEGCSGSISA